MSATQIDETTFTKAFLRLLSSETESSNALSQDYRADPTSLGSHPHTPLMAMPQAKKKIVKSQPSGVATGTVILKSIRAPKFTKELLNVPLNETILTVKESLIKEEPILHGYNPSNMKFLVKGKFIGDAKILAEVAGDSDDAITFTVMISGEKGVAEDQHMASTTVSPEASVAAEIPAYLAANVWKPIYDALIQGKIDPSVANSLIDDCKALIKQKTA